MGLDLPLLEWLQKYTFPLEKSLSDTNVATKVYNSAVNATLNSGTTCAAYFATIHRESCEILCDVVEQKQQRALVGKVDHFFSYTRDINNCNVVIMSISFEVLILF